MNLLHFQQVLNIRSTNDQLAVTPRANWAFPSWLSELRVPVAHTWTGLVWVGTCSWPQRLWSVTVDRLTTAERAAAAAAARPSTALLGGRRLLREPHFKVPAVGRVLLESGPIYPAISVEQDWLMPEVVTERAVQKIFLMRDYPGLDSAQTHRVRGEFVFTSGARGRLMSLWISSRKKKKHGTWKGSTMARRYYPSTV